MIHNPRTCNAFHSACENARDAIKEFPLEASALDLTLTQLDALAETYIQTGISTCTCNPERN